MTATIPLLPQAMTGLMGRKQLGFSESELTTAKKQTKRERFLSEMEVVVPWQLLIELIKSHYSKTSKKSGRPPNPLATILRIHLLQQWHSLSHSAMEEALIKEPTIRLFAGIELISDQIPDEIMIFTFCHLLEKHRLGEQIVEIVKAHLSARGMTMRQGTIVDATLLAAPSPTFTSAKPECAGGTRTRRRRGIRRCISAPQVHDAAKLVGPVSEMSHTLT
jgi:IS5 family transposase